VQKVEAIRDIGKRENCFALHTTSRTTNLQALSIDDRSEWIRMIHEVTARLRPSTGVFTSPRLLPGSASSKFSPFFTSPSSYLPTSTSTSTASLRLAQLSRGSLASDISECSVAFDNSSATSLCCSDFDSCTDPTNSDRISRSNYTGSLGRAGATTGGTGTETNDDLSLSDLVSGRLPITLLPPSPILTSYFLP
jgi:hypothetical protein